jgi:hypothetical protein
MRKMDLNLGKFTDARKFEQENILSGKFWTDDSWVVLPKFEIISNPANEMIALYFWNCRAQNPQSQSAAASCQSKNCFTITRKIKPIF